jgi:hypothetical protein
MLSRTLRENPDILALRDHKQELLLGRTTANTLELHTDNIGLAFTVTLPKTQIGDDTAENVRLRNLTGCSFGFTVVQDSWAADADGNVVRTLLDVDLWEISITSFAAYQATSVSARSHAAEMRSKMSQRADDDDEGYQPECDPESSEYDADATCDADDDEVGLDEEDSTRADRVRIRQLFNSRHKVLTQ